MSNELSVRFLLVSLPGAYQSYNVRSQGGTSTFGSSVQEVSSEIEDNDWGHIEVTLFLRGKVLRLSSRDSFILEILSR